jgi:tRNA modification GTPase
MAAVHAQAALITPLGEGGIGTIALWGADAAEVLGSVFKGTRRQASSLPPGALAHGAVYRDGKVVDEVIVARTASPYGGASGPYFEVNCHGGVVAVRTVLACIERAGARIVDQCALVSEDSERNALSASGIRARALGMLPAAPTRLAATMLLHQAAGALSAELESVARLLAHDRDEAACDRIAALAATYPLGGALCRPPRTALIGPPNVGKSTLLNALLEEERVIVHHEPGTTRDVVVERVSVRGVPFDLMDSAGIRATADDVEQEAVARAGRLATECDVALVVCDASSDAVGGAENLPQTSARAILVLNKADLLEGEPAPEVEDAFADMPVVLLSAKLRENIEALEDALLAPYAHCLDACRRGGAVLFHEAQAQAVASVEGILAASGSQAALSEMVELGACRPAGP